MNLTGGAISRERLRVVRVNATVARRLGSTLQLTVQYLCHNGREQGAAARRPRFQSTATTTQSSYRAQPSPCSSRPNT
eukprot:7152100-Prymnesium_polylepis.2